MSRIYLMTLAIVLSINSFAQYSINGTITDSISAPLPGATVRILNTNKGTFSGASGHFQLSQVATGDFQLQISAIGFETVNLPLVGINSDTTLNVALSTNVELLDEVMISATRASENAPFAQTSIDYGDIEKNNLGQDLPFLLQNEVSIVTTSDAGAGIGYTGFRLRGSDATRINVTVNGIPINDSESQGVYWVNMSDIASSTENIQIQRGVGSSTNGAGAFGGSVNLQTNGLKDKAYGEISTSYGSFNSQKITGKFGTGLIKDHWVLDARGSTIHSDGYIDRATADLKSYYISGAYYGKKSVVKAIHFAGHERTYQSWWGTPESRINGDVAAMNTHADNNWLSAEQRDNLLTAGRTYNYYDYENEVDNYNQDHYQLHLSHQFNSHLTVNAAGHYTYGRGYYEQFRGSDDLAAYGLDNVILDDTTITNSDIIRRRWLDNHFYGMTYNVKYQKEKLNLILGGAANKYEGGHFGEIIWSEYASNSELGDRYYDNVGIKTDVNSFLKTDYQFSDRLTGFVDLQVRMIGYSVAGIDNNLLALSVDTNFTFFNPKAGLSYAVKDNWNVFGSLSVANREPVRNDFIDNPANARPAHEQLLDYEVGTDWKSAKAKVTANVYYMDYKNQLVPTGALNDVGSVIRTNVDKSFRRGLELSGQYLLGKKVSLTANTTLSQNKIEEFTEVVYDYTNGYEVIENEFSNTDISLSPNVIGAFGVEIIPIKSMQLAIQGKHVGKQFLDNTSNDGRAIAAYQTVDTRLSYSLYPKVMRELTFNLMVNNVLNAMYSSNGYTYGYVYGDLITENFYYPQAGINFLMGMTAKF